MTLITKRDWFGLVALTVIAWAVRVFLMYHNDTWTAARIMEAGTTALRIIAGQGFSGEYHFAPEGPTAIPYPFYTYFLAGWYSFLEPGTAHFWIMHFQCAASAWIVPLVFFVARRAFNTPVAWLASIAVTFDYFLALTPLFISQPMWHIFAMLLTVAAASGWRERPNLRRTILTGVLIGAGTYVKTTMMLTWPAIAWWFLRRSEVAPFRRIGYAFLMGLATALVLAPLVVRNYMVFGKWGVINNSGGLNFWQGNFDQANGGQFSGDGVGLQTLVPPHIIDEVSHINEAEGAEVFYREGWDWAKRHPVRFLELRVKTIFFVFYNQNYWMQSPKLPYNPALKAITVVMVTWCLLSIPFCTPWWREHSLLLAILVVQVAVYSLYHADVDNRFRLPLEPFLLMYGSATIWRLFSMIRARPST